MKQHGEDQVVEARDLLAEREQSAQSSVRYAAVLDSQYRAGAKAGWNAAHDENPDAAIARLIRVEPGAFPGEQSAQPQAADGHDYSRTGKHDPLWCRQCLSVSARYWQDALNVAHNEKVAAEATTEQQAAEIVSLRGIVDLLNSRLNEVAEIDRDRYLEFKAERATKEATQRERDALQVENVGLRALLRLTTTDAAPS